MIRLGSRGEVLRYNNNDYAMAAIPIMVLVSYLIVEVVNVFFDGRIGIHIVGRIANGTATGRIET